MPDQDGLRFLFDIQDKITAKLAKIESKAVASAKKIDKAFSKASQAQQANAAKVVQSEKLRSIAVENATAKATASRTKETAQGKILAQRLAAAQASEARKAENFRVAAAKRTAAAIVKSERAAANAGKKTSRTFQTFSQTTFAGMVSAAGAIALAGKAWKAFTGFIKSGFALWAEQEQSVAAMTTALKAQGEYTPALSKQYQDMASELQGLSTHGDETLIKMQALLIQVGDVGPDKMRGALTAAQDLATGLDVDLKTAALLVGKAFAGDTSTLKRYGIVLDQTELKQRGVAVVLEAIQAKFGGQAAAKAQTFGGIIEQLGNSWGDLKEKIGKWLTQSSGLLTPMLAKISGAVTWLNDNFEEIKPVLAAVAAALAVGLVVGLGALGAVIYATVIPALATMNIAMSANPIGIVVLALAAVAYAWVKWGDAIKDFLRAVWAKMLDKIGAGLETLASFVGIFSDEWGAAMGEAAAGLRKTADEMANAETGAEKLAREQVEAAKSAEELAKGQAKAAKESEKLAKAQAKAEKSAKAAKAETEAEAVAVNKLADSWTGATIKSGQFLKAYSKLTPEQKKNDRIMGKVLTKYHDIRKVHGPFNEELEEQWRTTRRLNPAIAKQEKETAKLVKEEEKLNKEAEILNDRLEDQRRRLLGLPTDKAIQAFAELTATYEELTEAEKEVATEEFTELLLAAEDAGIKLDAAQIALIASTGHLTKEQEKLKKEAEGLNDRLEKQRKRLLGLPTEAAIQAFEELTQTWEGLNEAEKAVATKAYSAALRDAAAAGHELNDAQIELGNSAGAAWVDSFFWHAVKGIRGRWWVYGRAQVAGVERIRADIQQHWRRQGRRIHGRAREDVLW